jgi:Flp pilus assembly protein TadG
MLSGSAGRRKRERGQGLVEFSLVLPAFLMLLLIMLEFGLAFNHKLTIGYATREGARTGSALASGGVTDCSGGNDPSGVDNQIIAAVQRILKSPGSDVNMNKITQIRIYQADSAGAQIGSNVNTWVYTPGAGPDADPDAGVDLLDFSPTSVAWPACVRSNTSPNPDSVGVRILYDYDLQTPLRSLVMFVGGSQAATLSFTDQTIMALNPTG